MPDRAVSDVVSFVLVFSLITLSVGTVSVFGLGSLQDARNAERINNGERAFDVLADNQRDIAHGGAPSRATEIKLAETTLTLDEPLDSSVTLSDGTQVGSTESRPITFRLATDQGDLSRGVVYEMGAILRVDPGGAVMQRTPPFQFDENRTVIHYLTLESRTGAVQRQSGSTTILVRTEHGTTAVLSHTEPSDEVTISVNTEPRRAAAWKRYFEDELAGMSDGTPCQPLDGSGEVTCSFETDDLLITRTTIRTNIG
ncbi:DUF7289 family protein [Haloplanus sp. C73]|uniref:DUF7289 family protein n=1 Tax=Haloplanus sp. C73 TaxID=3421641 RepID=UPI003EBF5729